MTPPYKHTKGEGFSENLYCNPDLDVIKYRRKNRAEEGYPSSRYGTYRDPALETPEKRGMTMKKRLVCGLLALVLMLSMLPFGALAEETAETTAPTSVTENTASADVEKSGKSVDPTLATDEPKTTDPTEDTKPTDPTGEAKSTDPTTSTGETGPTEETKATDPTGETKATDPTEGTETTETTEETAPAAPTPVEQVQSLIDALPETVTAENREEVEARLTAIDDAKLALTDEERDGLDFTRYNAAIAAINELDDMAGAEIPQTLVPSGDSLGYYVCVDAPLSTSGGRCQLNELSSGILYGSMAITDNNYNAGYVLNDGDGSGYGFTINSTSTISAGETVDLVWWSADIERWKFDASLIGKTVTIIVNTSNYDSSTGNGLTMTVLEVPNGEYLITLNPKGGTFSSGETGVLVTTSKTLPTLPTPTKTGGAFLGWYADSTKYSAGDTVSSDMTLTAKWADPNNVTTKEELLACINDTSVTTIKLGAQINLTEDLTISGRTLTLDLNGNILGSTEGLTLGRGTSLTLTDSGSGGKLAFNTMITLESVDTVLNVNGGELVAVKDIQNYGTIYLNGGDAGGNAFDNAGTIYFKGTTFTGGCGFKDDLAKKAGKCLVTFYKGEADNSNQKPLLSIAVTKGDKIKAPDATVKGLVFLGWTYRNMTSGEPGDEYWNFDDGVQSSIELYTHYCQEETYITYAKGDEHPDATGTAPAPATREYGKAFTLAAAAFRKDGYVQIGWVDKEDRVRYYPEEEIETKDEIIYEELTLVPVWEKVVTYQIPFTKTVRQKGDIKPGKATFSLKCIGELIDYPGVQTISGWSGDVTTNGTGTFKGTLTITGPESILNEQLAQGIYVQELDSKQSYWRYDTTIYCIRRDATENITDDGESTITYGDIYCYQVKNTEDDHEPTEKEKLKKMSFTNSYTESTNPKTGESILLPAATLLLTTTALIAMVPRKKRR